MFMSGARIGTTTVTTHDLRNEIRAGLRAEPACVARGLVAAPYKVTRTAARSGIPPEFKYADYGFRIARTNAP